MRIAFLHMTLGLVDRGSEISTDMIARELAKTNEVLVIGSGNVKNTSYKYKRIYPLDSAPSPAPNNTWEKILFRLHLDDSSRHVVNFTLKARDEIRRFSPEIIVAVNGAVQVKILKQEFPTVKIVVFGRAGIGHDDLSNLKSSPDLFVALSEQAKFWADEHKKKNTKAVYIPNPIDLDLYQKAKAQKLTLPHPILLVVGALTSYKNIDKVVRVARDLGVSLLLIGDGEQSDRIASLLSSYHGEFKWIKHLDPSELPGYYRSADAFCLIPDSQESFGRVYIEAMAAGLPIVASDDEVRRGIIGEQGIYIDPHNTSELTQALRQALTIKKKLSYKNELQEYDLKKVVKDIEKELHEL